MQFVLGKSRCCGVRISQASASHVPPYGRLATVSESARPDERLLTTTPLLQQLGWWGAMGMETIRDPSDGQDKLMEINPRFPRQLWNRIEMGINEPLMCIRIARGESVEPVREYPLGVLFVSPVEDVQLFAIAARRSPGAHVADSYCRPSVRGRVDRAAPRSAPSGDLSLAPIAASEGGLGSVLPLLLPGSRDVAALVASVFVVGGRGSEAGRPLMRAGMTRREALSGLGVVGAAGLLGGVVVHSRNSASKSASAVVRA